MRVLVVLCCLSGEAHTQTQPRLSGGNAPSPSCHLPALLRLSLRRNLHHVLQAEPAAHQSCQLPANSSDITLKKVLTLLQKVAGGSQLNSESPAAMSVVPAIPEPTIKTQQAAYQLSSADAPSASGRCKRPPPCLLFH